MIQSILPAFQTRLWENVLRYLCESFFRRVRKSNWRCIVAGVLAVGLAVSHICFYPWVINGLRGEQVLLVDQISEFDQFGARSTRTIVLATAPDTVGENTKNFSIYFWMNGWVCERVSAKNYDGNKNAISMTDAEDNGSAGADTSTVLYDGFDRALQTDRRLRQLLSLRLRRSQPGHPQSILGPRRRQPPRKLNKQQTPQPIPRQARRARPSLRKLRRPLRHPNGTILDTYTSKPRFDRRSLTILARNPRGYTSSVVYDGLGRSVLSTDAKSNTVETIYDNNSNVLQTKRTEVETSTQTYYSDFQYDAADRQILSVDTLGNTHRSFYDSTSQLVASTDANSSGTASIATQSRGGSFSITGNSDGNRIFYLTDRLGRSLATIRELRVNHDGANSVDTSNSYNSDGLITTSTFYDDNSRVTSRTDDKNNATSYAYDALNRKTSKPSPTRPAAPGPTTKTATS
jgi:YD repeat-containing protein